jgi:hypothetical protein
MDTNVTRAHNNLIHISERQLCYICIFYDSTQKFPLTEYVIALEYEN